MKTMWAEKTFNFPYYDHVVIYWRGVPIYKNWYKNGRKAQSSCLFNTFGIVV
jgi:hypothetical protein